MMGSSLMVRVLRVGSFSLTSTAKCSSRYSSVLWRASTLS